MTLDVAFFVPIEPMPMPRPRFSMAGGFVTTHNTKEAERHQLQFAAFAARHRPKSQIDSAVGIDLLFVLPRSKALSRRSKRTDEPLTDPRRRWHTARPDIDNLAKMVLDSLRSWWVDDALVAGLNAAKVIAAIDERCGYHVRLRTIDAWMRRGGEL